MVYVVIWGLFAALLMIWKRWVGALFLVGTVVLCVLASGASSADVAAKRSSITVPAASAAAALKDGVEKLTQ